MARVPLSKGKERAKAKIKAGQKANASKASNFSMSDFKVRYASGKPVVTAAPKKAAAPVKKAETKKVEVKKVVAQKPEVKPNNKDLINKMTRTGQAYYLDTKSGKVEKNPDVKNTIKKAAEAAKNKQTKVVKSKIESLKRPEIRKETIKQEVVLKPKKENTPTVSQLWQQKTGTSWSEAKKQGLTDGSAAANIALMKKLNSGTVNKESIKAPKPGTAASMDVFKKEVEKNVQSELSGETTYEPPVPAMRRGGSIKKYQFAGQVSSTPPSSRVVIDRTKQADIKAAHDSGKEVYIPINRSKYKIKPPMDKSKIPSKIPSKKPVPNKGKTHGSVQVQTSSKRSGK